MARSSRRGRNNSVVGEILEGFIVRVESLDEQIAALKADQREVLQEAKARGIDIKTMKEMIRDRKLEPAERAERNALRQIYSAALGMLDGTDLGNAAIARLMGKPPESLAPDETADKPDDGSDAPAAPPIDDIETARAKGDQAARSGKPVTDNPYPPATPQRAAYDEGWCHAAGSDGMDIPAAWQRSKPAKKDAKPDADGADDDGDDADADDGDDARGDD